MVCCCCFFYSPLTIQKTLLESLVFLDSIVQYKQTEDHAVRFNLLAVMVSTYIKVNSPSELNISSSTRECILQEFVKALSSSDPCSFEFFDKVADELLLQLQSEHFPRFLHSPYYKMSLHGDSQIIFADSPDDEQAAKPIANELVDFSKPPTITEEDFENLERLSNHDANSNTWKAVAQKKHTRAFVSVDKYKMTGSKSELRMCKFISEFECSAGTCVVC